MKKCIVWLLLPALLALAGCTQSPDVGDDPAAANAQTQMAYRATYLELPQQVEYLYEAQFAQDRVWFVDHDYDEQTQKAAAFLASFKSDGTDYQRTALALPEEMNVQSFCIAGDGAITALSAQYDPQTYRPAYSLLRFSADGALLSNMALEDIFEGQDAYIQHMIADPEGNLALFADDRIEVIDPQGKPLFSLTLDGWYQDAARAGDGSIVVAFYANAGGPQLKKIDIAAKTLADAVTLGSSMGNLELVDGDASCWLYAISNGKLQAYNDQTQSFDALFDFLDLDYSSNNINCLFHLSEDQFLLLGRDYNGEPELARIALTQYSENKTILTLGTLYANSDLTEKIVDFNRKNDQYRIELIDYMDDRTTDYTAALDRFSADMVTGSMPDIVDVSSLPFDTLAGKGLFADLYPLLDQDETLSREDFIPSVLGAMETDGKLYFVSDTVSVLSMIGLKSVLGDISGWTMQEFEQKLAENPQITMPIASSDQSTTLMQLVMIALEDFIDPETGKCSFDSEAFIALLNIAAKAPAQIDYQNMPRDAVLLHEKKTLAVPVSLYDITDFQQYTVELEDDFCVVGFPSQNRERSMAYFSNMLAVSAKCEHPQAAWSFLATLIRGDNQRHRFGIPVLAQPYEEMIQEAMEPSYYTDENGNQVEQSKMGIGYSDGTNLEIYAATQQEAQAFRQIVESISGRRGYQEKIFEILNEDCAPFFAGQKSAQETAAVVQSRIQTYINENR